MLGIFKLALGFLRFGLRGIAKARLEWTLTYNLQRLFHIGANLVAA